MARIYEKRITDTQRIRVADVEDPAARRNLARFWISVAVVVIASGIFYLLARRVMISRNALIIAMGVAGAAIVFLVVMGQSMRRLKLVSRQDVEGARFVRRNLAQLDDRFAIFPDARVSNSSIDQLIVGPTGIFALNSRFALVSGRMPNKADIQETRQAAEGLTALAQQLVPEFSMTAEAVLCVMGDKNAKVRRTEDGVWIVPAERIVASLLKRSSREGAITHGVNETGAFSSDTLQTGIFESALAKHWSLAPEKNYTDFLPPAAEMTTPG